MVQMVWRRVPRDILAAQGVKLAHVRLELICCEGIDEELVAFIPDLQHPLIRLGVNADGQIRRSSGAD
jgi:hypothetical protein